jgi:hypothetical protein
MTFSRPAIERLIATVESGLAYGELGPYASALRECLDRIASLEGTVDSGNEAFRVAREQWRAEVTRLTAERDHLERDVGALRRMLADMGKP